MNKESCFESKQLQDSLGIHTPSTLQKYTHTHADVKIHVSHKRASKYTHNHAPVKIHTSHSINTAKIHTHNHAGVKIHVSH